ncbi:hypothetical protein RR46_13976 [Papilio xuthus]|uniref:Uncharacterized protein n=1 Tax=Papilio xuthus TaxID=66420 RepID=A0A194PNQ3_PAPXU|nr:hypothetical protein RR46_13976 [Papilio xuthus]
MFKIYFGVDILPSRYRYIESERQRCGASASARRGSSGISIANCCPPPLVRPCRLPFAAQKKQESEAFLRAPAAPRKKGRGLRGVVHVQSRRRRGSVSQWAAGGGAGARTPPRLRLAAAFYLLLRGSRRASGV